jgi:archaellum component FlaF (FlaF/FlaG flagellin family)
MKKSVLFLYAALLTASTMFISCENDDPDLGSSSQTKPELVLQAKSGKVTFNGKEMNFENFKTFVEYQAKINDEESFKSQIYAKYNKQLAIGHLNDNSFSKKFLFEKLTNDYLHSVNAEGMIIISGELIRFDKEYQYAVPIKNRYLITISKEQDLDLKLVKRDTYGITNLKSDIVNGRTSQITLPSAGSSAYVSAPFVIGAGDPGAGSSRRYIHELFTHKGASSGGQTQHRLMLRFRMQYFGGGGNWYNAGEPRSIYYDVKVNGGHFAHSSGGAYLDTPGCPCRISNSQVTTNPEERLLREVFTSSNSSGTWENVIITGIITSRLNSPNNYFYSYTNGGPFTDEFTAPALW